MSARPPVSGRGKAAPRFLDAGEAALVVEFGEEVDPEINARVLALDAALAARSPDGLRELAPTYRSLMIHYEPLSLSRESLVATVEDCLLAAAPIERNAARWTIPCCYEVPSGEDVAEVAALLGVSADRFARSHGAATYRAYMYGFSPGYTYLGGLPPELAVPRRPSPRAPHAPGAVLLGGGLCSISTFSMPTGWYVIGQTPERLYAPDRARPFLLEPGDMATFEPVDHETFRLLDARARAGEIVAKAAKP